MSFLKKNSAILLLITLISILFSFVSISKHDHFQSFAWDLAFFDELIWKVSHGIEPRSSLNNLHILGDHFQPVILLFAPLYMLNSDVRMLLIAHTVIATLSVLPIYLLAKKLLKHELLSLSVSLSFLLFTGYQYAVFDGFHQSVFASLFLSWLYYSLETKRTRGICFSILGLLFTKEEYTLLLVAIGIVIIFFYKRLRFGIGIILTSIVSLFLLIYLAIPYFQQGPYTHFGYGEMGSTPQEVLINIFTRPNQLLLLLFSAEKINTVFTSLFSFGFLPLLTPLHLLPILQQYGVRFIDTVSIHRSLNLNHYSFPLSPLLSIATIYSLKRLAEVPISKNKLAVYLLSFVFLQNVYFHGPINSVFKKHFYEFQPWEKNAHELIYQIPFPAIVASQNSLLPHLSGRNKYYLLPEVENSEYVAVDLNDGPNKYSPLNHSQTQKLIDALLESKTFEVIWQKGESRLLKRIN
ncbi:MAG: DUF2079 domain-containing protein [Patescibacteria group bacterium]